MTFRVESSNYTSGGEAMSRTGDGTPRSRNQDLTEKGGKKLWGGEREEKV